MPIIDIMVSAIISILTGVLGNALFRGVRKHKKTEKPYGERLAELMSGLTKASSEVDSVLAELAETAQSREKAVRNLEADLAALESRENDAKQRIEALEKTPLPVAEHFARLLRDGEKKSARRDYLLFGAGVLVTTLITIVIQFISTPK